MRSLKLPSRVKELFRSRRVRLAAACAGTLLIGLGALLWMKSSGRLSGVGVRTLAPVQARPAGQVRANPLLRPEGIVNFADGCMTSGCHAELSRARYVHQPVAQDECGKCHGPDSGGHRFPVLADLSGRCTACHAINQGPGTLHAGRSDVGCNECHASHSSEARFMLASGGERGACSKCHGAGHEASTHASRGGDRCELCHVAHTPGVRVALAGGGNDAGTGARCATCHGQKLTGGAGVAPGEARALPEHRGHAGVQGSCVACHREHGRTPGTQRDIAGECLRCHQDIAKALASSKVTADAEITRAGCTECHDPHDASRAFMLRSDEASLCLKCHAKPIAKSGGGMIAGMADIGHDAFKHGPVELGRCGVCHAGHGGGHTSGVTLAASRAPLGRFDLKNYAMCFACHDKSLVLDDGEKSTAFRDGDRNLHRLHVQAGERSRSCGSCHAAHGAPNPRLLADAAAYDGSEWKVKLGFALTSGGGSCAPGCHVPMKYQRGGASGGGQDAGKPRGGVP